MFHIWVEALIHWEKKITLIASGLSGDLVRHGTSFEQKLSARPNRYKEEESCSGIIAVVLRHVRIFPPFSGFPQNRFCHLLLSIEGFRRLPCCLQLLAVFIVFLFL